MFIINIYILLCLLTSISNKNSEDEKSEKSKETIETISSIVGGVSGALKDTTRFVKNHKFSPKYYKSAWGGGSPAKIKTYKLGKVGKSFGAVTNAISLGMSAKEVVETYQNEGSKEGTKKIFKEGGSFVGGLVGAKVGASVGTAICPVIGTAIGGIIGGITGRIGGENIIRGGIGNIIDFLWK